MRFKDCTFKLVRIINYIPHLFILFSLKCQMNKVKKNKVHIKLSLNERRDSSLVT